MSPFCWAHGLSQLSTSIDQPAHLGYDKNSMLSRLKHTLSTHLYVLYYAVKTSSRKVETVRKKTHKRRTVSTYTLRPIPSSRQDPLSYSPPICFCRLNTYDHRLRNRQGSIVLKRGPSSLCLELAYRSIPLQPVLSFDKSKKINLTHW